MTEHVFRRLRHGKRDRLFTGRYALGRGEKPVTVALDTPDRLVALKRLRDIIVEKQREREGLVAPRAEREAAGTPLVQLVAEYEADLRARGRGHSHIRNTGRRIAAALAGTGWKRLADVRPDQFARWRAGLAIAAKTQKEYQAAFCAFLNWLVAMGRLGHNPLATLPRVETRGRQVKHSRAFTLDELRKLCAAVPATRRLAYLMLAYTGQRKNEAKTLLWGDVHLDGERPHLLLRAEETKDRTKRPIPLHPDLAAEMRAYRERAAGQGAATPDQRVFVRFPDYSTLRADLERAGIEHRDASGRVVHFHAFRKTFQTFGVQAGVNQRAAQELLGHSDANLTAKIYTDVPALALHGEVAKLPWLNDATVGPPGSVRPAVPSRFLELCRELVEVAESFDLARVAHELSQKKLASPAGFEPAFSP